GVQTCALPISEVLTALATGGGEHAELAEALRGEGAIILAGERLGMVPGGYTALLKLVEATGARLAWVPRRAGDRGAVEVGLLPGLLPGGGPTAQAHARVVGAPGWGGAGRTVARRRRPRRVWTSPRSGVSRSSRPHRDATTPRSSPLPPTARSSRCWSVVSTWRTCPTPLWLNVPWQGWAPSSSWRCAALR